ncbi:hypothetical protein F5X68DRAFT_246402 [Plectosphaerella plurivora]|uniref:Palmitoyltransferase n=1 Tax=Plectosphaerella plurivora TaxID=936078 RepID=A0A9P8V5A5_9PEZI|nr:hypothetical protein F5X68DRAFT_246402 [Plectosphaerella plurivora]
MASIKEMLLQAFRLLERLLPVFLLAYMIFSSLVMYNITVRSINPVDDGFVLPALPRSLGFGLCAVWLFLLLGFVSSILTAWYYSWMHAPFYRPFGPLSHPFWLPRPFRAWKPPVLRWQQAVVSVNQLIRVGGVFALERGPHTTVNKCVRPEGHCQNGQKRRKDRMYHGYWPKLNNGLVDACLPLYDHWCHYICVLVYLHSIKSYILTMTYLVLYGVFVFVVTVWAATRPEFEHVKKYAVGISVFSCIMVVWVGMNNLTDKVYNLVLRNVVGYESRHPSIFTMAFPVADKFVIGNPPACPWDQGSWRKNWTHTMGPGWLAWIPFWQPQRVRDYDDPNKYDFDEKFGPNFERWTRSAKNARMIEQVRAQGEIRAPPAARRRRELATNSSVDV